MDCIRCNGNQDKDREDPGIHYSFSTNKDLFHVEICVACMMDLITNATEMWPYKKKDE